MLSLLATLIPVVPAAANHRRATLNVRPESASRALDTSHTMTAELDQLVTVEQGSISIDFENQNGVNDADGTTYDSPDLDCLIAAGERSCTVTYTGTVTGRDTWRAWIDHDGRDATVEADRDENRNEDRDPGNGGTICNGAAADGEPDCTDVVEVLWGTGALDCDDARGPDTERNTNPAGGGAVSNEVYTCKLLNATSRPDAGALIRAEVVNGTNDPDEADGASYNTPDYRCTTDDGTQGTTAGACQITVTQNESESGTAHICFWAGPVDDAALVCADETVDEGQEADGSDAGNDMADAVEKTWEVRSAGEGGIDAEQETGRSGFGAYTVTVTVFDQFGQPFNGNTEVRGEFFEGSPSDVDGSTPGTHDLSCTTVNDSTCTFTYNQAVVPGTDLICFWTGETPNLAGTNNSGTCDTEPLVDPDDTEAAAEAPAPAGDDVDVVQKIWEYPTDATRLDCAPETQNARRNTSPRIACSVTDDLGNPVASAEIDAEAVGANDPDAGDAPVPPDFSCVTNAQGDCSLQHGPNGVGSTDDRGSTFYRIWIDADNDNGTSEADTGEDVDEGGMPGQPEPDDTDAVTIGWSATRCDIVGTAGADRLVGNKNAQVICGLGGNDRILAGGGADRIFGDGGKDSINAHGGNDRVDGGSGNDTILGKDGRDVLKGNSGRDVLYGGKGRDRCYGGPGRDRTRSC